MLFVPAVPQPKLVFTETENPWGGTTLKAKGWVAEPICRTTVEFPGLRLAVSVVLGPLVGLNEPPPISVQLAFIEGLSEH